VSRLQDVERFYAVVAELRERLGGVRHLRDCSGSQPWPIRGVYFFLEPGQERTTSGSGLRVVRVGTHAISSGSTTTLWNRLSQHRGVTRSGGGNHRGSIFRLLVGEALIRREGLDVRSWSVGSSRSEAAARLGVPQEEIRDWEAVVELAVSRVIRDMPFLWLNVDDAPGPGSMRALIERNAIALLSNSDRAPVDAPSEGWLGLHSGRERVRRSALWNNNFTDERYDPSFIDELARAVASSDRLK
jgi:hypothetical protein